MAGRAANTFPPSCRASASGSEPTREQIFNQQEELQRKLDEINREFAAIEAYESAKTGKAARGGHAPAGRQPRARRGSRREQLLNLIREGNGLSRGRNPGAHGVERRQVRRDVGIQRAHRAHKAQ